jgi:shikimate dehydrogenase
MSSWEFDTLVISSSTKLYGIIGDPIAHSLSPLMQNAAFEHHGLDSIYLAFRVIPQDLEGALAGMKSLGVRGFNVTVPHKVAVMSYLDAIDPIALEIGAVNTVVEKDDALIGYNTDGSGALAALRESEVQLDGRKATILGAGGAARALAFSLAPLVESLVILNRTGSRAKELANSVVKWNPNVEGKPMSDTTLHNELLDTDILVNATSVGMYPHIDESIVGPECLRQGMIVFEIVYNPLVTHLLRDAEAVGARIVRGDRMLVFQGALGFELWTGEQPPIEEMSRAIEGVLQEV